MYFPGPWEKQNKPTRLEVKCFTSMGLKSNVGTGEVGSIVGGITACSTTPIFPPLSFNHRHTQFFLNCTSHPSIPIKVLLFFDISFF
jgi:hypothetical protein